jgi:hypothetical protein
VTAMENETNQDTMRMLRAIVGLLLSLANMAERASRHSRALCAVIVWILRPAEAAVSDYTGFAPEAAETFRSGDVLEDAARLAWRLRAMADEIMCEMEFALMAMAGARGDESCDRQICGLKLSALPDLLDRLRYAGWLEVRLNDTS